MKSLTCYGHPRVEGVVGGLMLDWLRGGCGCSRQRTLVAPGESSARAWGLAVSRFRRAGCRSHKGSQSGAPFLASVTILLLATGFRTVCLGVLLLSSIQFTCCRHWGVVWRVLRPRLVQCMGLGIRQPQRKPSVLVATTTTLVHAVRPVEATLLKVGVHSDQSLSFTKLGNTYVIAAPRAVITRPPPMSHQIPDNEI